MEIENKMDYQTLKSSRRDVKKIFFYRICGTGMGGAACLLKERGYDVEGGDNLFNPPMSDYLISTGIRCHKLDEIDRDYLNDFDLIIVGNVVPAKSKDSELIESLDVPFTSFPMALGALILDDMNVVGISGTHGKTTTTFFMVQVFEKLGYGPGYLIGGVIDGRPSTKLGTGDYFFIEADEYDSAYFDKVSKFRMYSIDHLILTSLEFDHGDIFRNLEEIKDQFRALIPAVTSSYLFNGDYQASKELMDEFKNHSLEKSWKIYGEKSEIGLQIISADRNGTNFSLRLDGKICAFQTNLLGLHNILNLSSVIIFAYNSNIEVERITEAVKSLEMVKRRQEERGKYKGALVIDDFAHHPRAVKYTIDGIKQKYPEKKIVAVMCPESATARSSIFQDEFVESLENADVIILVSPSVSTSIKGAKDIDCKKMIKLLVKKGKIAIESDSLDQLFDSLDKFADQETLFLVLGNSTCNGLWGERFVAQIEA